MRCRVKIVWLASVLFQEFLHFNGGHASASGCGDGLAVTAVLDITTGINAMDARVDVVVRLQITIGIGVELPLEHLRVWIVADAQEQGARGEVGNLAGFQVSQFEASDFVFDGIVYILHHSIGEEMNLFMVLRAFQHNF